MDKHIIKAIFHIPQINHNDVDLTACKVLSFNNVYQSLNFVPLLYDKQTSSIIKTDVIILKSKIKGGGFSVIKTVDSCYPPQILEIKLQIGE